MNEASSLTDTVLGSGRELHVQQLFPAAAFHLISADGRVDLALVIMIILYMAFSLAREKTVLCSQSKPAARTWHVLLAVPTGLTHPFSSAGRPAQHQPFLLARSPQANSAEQQCREASQSAKNKIFY